MFNLAELEQKRVFIASKAVDFRLGINGLYQFIEREQQMVHLDVIYVFHNGLKDKVKCLFWDRNGFVLYYKKLDHTKFKLRNMLNRMEEISFLELDELLSGAAPIESLGGNEML